ncbi:MAG: tripartite tricarboxylate transporter substrate binding protein [Burkholderiaceae bacterium]|nr:tripartite tricarboxylate transporter substrate binding protein [Burkholderiaceae bacterium]MDO9090822.1 tripartite tricarboxylate transporter substrate binding protein [Burkholderiaceae bacterium]
MNLLKKALTVLSLLAAGAAFAQTYPTKPVRLIVPYASGGEIDAVARYLARKLEDKWKQPVVVDNRPGAGSVIGTDAAAKADPDGHTLLLTSFGFVTNQILMRNLPYDPASLAPLMRLAMAPNILYVTSSVPGTTAKEVAEYARSKPGQLSFASTGNGSSPHIVAEMFAVMAGATITHVPYKGTAPAVTDLLGGHVQAIFGTMSLMPNTKDGKLRALTVANPTRLIGAPQVPTTAESGLPGLLSASWYGLFLPAKVDPALRQKIYADLRDVANQEETRQRLIQIGLEPATLDSNQFGAFLKAEHTKWGDVIRQRNIRLD